MKQLIILCTNLSSSFGKVKKLIPGHLLSQLVQLIAAQNRPVVLRTLGSNILKFCDSPYALLDGAVSLAITTQGARVAHPIYLLFLMKPTAIITYL